MTSAAAPALAMAPRSASSLLRPSATSAASAGHHAQLNIETLTALKDRLASAANNNNNAPAGSSSSSAASSASTAAPSGGGHLSALNLPSLTWLTFMRTLPPSAAASSSSEVVALKSAFAAFTAGVSALVDDERSGTALAETAAVVYRCAAQLQAQEEAATAAAHAAAAATSTGADSYASVGAPSAELLAQLKAIAASVRAELQKKIGRFPESQWKQCQTLAREVRRQATEMQQKFDAKKLARDLSRLPSAAAVGDGKDDSSGGHFMPSPRIDAAPLEPLLEREYGADLPLTMAEEDEHAPALVDDDDDDDDSLGSSLFEQSDLGTRPVRDVMQQLRARMRGMGLVPNSGPPVPPAAVPGSGSLLGLSPRAAAAVQDDNDDDSELEDVYGGESDEDDSERMASQISLLANQSVRLMHEPRLEKFSAATLPDGSLPTNPPQWWSYLVTQCERLVTYNEQGIAAVSGGEIAQQVLGILQSAKQDIQNDLLDLLGYECMDFLGQLLENRREIRGITSQHQALARQSKEERAQAEALSHTRKDKDGSVVRGLVGISIQTSTDIELNKNRKRADRRMARRSARDADDGSGVNSKTYIDQAKLDAQANSLKGLINASGASQSISQLPAGTTRTQHKGYEEVFIPALPAREIVESELRPISESFEPFAAQAFPRTKYLNRIQSRVYDAAYNHNGNLLICAPTGAGKTNVAMMCILREIGAHIENGVLRKDQFKMVYVAPMKALAQEVQSTFQKRLAPLGILVKELTGDMQLTRAEIADTQLLVTTPEKWDVVTRKAADSGGGGGAGSNQGLMSLVKLLIIDECHLLNEDRGPVLEILVARTLRMVESSQEMCRIVGLSATLPNYQDVAVFLRAGPAEKGLFHFDSSYRPVPLSQTFIGVTEKNQMLRIQSMNDVAYKKTLLAVQQGHQVMIFVHSRRDTVKVAKSLRDAAQKDQMLSVFDMSASPEYGSYEKRVQRSRNSEVREMFQYGFSMHHAGMVRPDRSLVESAFAAGLIKVLVCTATLAWGVNLPAHTVIIKGTQIYNAEKGGFEDVGMLDIMQIFGRAGRPQFDSSGEAILICEHEKLNRYLNLLTHQLPIESQFIKELPNHLNAEIILGTVSNLNEAVQWLSYTYLYTRMLRNPLAYGIKFDEMQYDELLVQHRTALIIEAAKLLMRCRMIKFDQRSGQFYSTDVGRVASHYYLHFESIELYNNLLQPIMSDEDVLHLLASSKEFAQIKTRDEELNEMESLAKKYAPIPIKGGRESATGKQNLLLQVYISNGPLDGPTLISDTYFLQQSAGRICRALFEMVLKRGKAYLAAKFLTWAQMIEKKIWHFQSPLRQFLVNANASSGSHGKGGAPGDEQRGGLLKMPTIMRLESANLKLDQLVDMTSGEISAVLKHDTLGQTVKQCLNYIPYLSVEAKVQPITRSVLRIDMELRAEFTWSEKQHGQAESFWIWIEDTNNEHIYHNESFLLHRRAVNDVHKLSFTIPIFEPLPPQYYIVIKSDRWIGSDNVHPLNFKHLILPEMNPQHTQLLDLHPLPRSALRNPAFERLYEKKFTHFNPVQTQIFHTLYHTDENILLGAPTGSGKTVVSELAMLRLFSCGAPGSKVVYIAPLKALARERIEDWTSARSFQGVLGKKIVELTGDTAPDVRAINAADIIITTPEKWDGISRSWSTRGYVRQVGLVIIDEIHLLGADRGPVLEVIVSRMRYISSHTASPIRIVGLSTALSNAKDLGDWLGIERAGLFNFPPSVRPVPLTIHIAGFAGKNYCPRMATMNRPTYAAIVTHSPSKPALVFVSSRRQTRLTGLDLIALSAADGNPRKFLHMNESTLQAALQHVQDPNLKHMLSFGIGMHHAGLSTRDRAVVEKLFLEFKIQVLVCTSTLAWGVNFPCHLVVVKGTEYYDAPSKRYVDFPVTDVLQMIGRAGRPQFDQTAVAVVLVHEPKRQFYINFLNSPFPVESSLLGQLHDHVNAEICSSGTIKNVGDFLDYLSWTFLFRRLMLNPSYYGLEGAGSEDLNAFLLRLVVGVVDDLAGGGLIAQDAETGRLSPLTLGKIASSYYLKYQTMQVFSDRMRPENGVEEQLVVLAHAQEFAELPTHILLQAHLSRLDFAVSDYYTDLKSVLDQSIRVLQAMVDTAGEAGWLRVCLNTMHLMQMVVQGRWMDDSPLLNLLPSSPGGKKILAALGREGLDRDVQKLVATERNKVAAAVRKAQASEKEVKEFMDLLSRLPMVNMQLFTIDAPTSSSGDSASSSSKSASSPANQHPLSLSAPLAAAAGSTLTLRVQLHRRNANPSVRIFTPVFSKPKDEAWWVLVGLSALPPLPTANGAVVPSAQDELVAIRRVNTLKTRSSIDLQVTLPPNAVALHTYTVYLVSDSYVGFDQQQTFRVSVGGAQATPARSGPRPPPGMQQAALHAGAMPANDRAAAAADPDDIYN